jgi:hypothetical protein
MKASVALFLLFALAQPLSAAEDWNGKNVLVSKGTLLCDESQLEKALKIRDAGDADTLIAFLEEGYCTVAPGNFYATVTDDKSSASNIPTIEITVEEQTGWLQKSSATCCYAKMGDDWEKTNKIKMMELLSDGSECGQAKRHLEDLIGAGFAGTAQYENYVTIKEEKCQ